MKENNKTKYIFIILTIGIVLFAIIIGLVIWHFKSSLKLNSYEKYTSNIAVVVSKPNDSKQYNIETTYDKEILAINADFNEERFYYSNNELVYIGINDGNEYVFRTGYSYINIYDIIKKPLKYKLSKKEDKNEVYDVSYDQTSINELFRCLYISENVNKEYTGEIVVLDNKIKEFHISIDGIEGYESIIVTLRFKELKEDFKIDKTSLGILDSSYFVNDDGVDIGITAPPIKETINLEENMLKILK